MKATERTNAQQGENANARPAGAAARQGRDAVPANARGLLAMQSAAGNSAVALMLSRSAGAQAAPPAPPLGGPVDAAVVQRQAAPADCPPAPVAPQPVAPGADPNFTAVAAGVTRTGRKQAAHPPAAQEARKAQDAAQPPGNDAMSQAKAAQADEMAAAEPKGFDKAAFIAAVKREIAKVAPRNLDEADGFADSGKAETVKANVMSQVTAGKERAAEDVTAKADATPDPSVAQEKAVVPLAEEQAPEPGDPHAARAMPPKAPQEQVNFQGGPCELEGQMQEAGVTDEHLEKSNEPDMQKAVAAKDEAKAHAVEAPARLRNTEAQTRQAARADAAAAGQAGVGQMFAAKTTALGQAGQQKSSAKAADEAARAKVAAEINTIYDTAKQDVEAILTGLDAKVAQEFEAGETRARAAFTAKHKRDMEAYKDERYAGLEGKARWTADLFTGLPDEANEIFAGAKAVYEQDMEQVISDVADVVATELAAAKARIDKGRAEIKDYVASQPAELRRIAGEAAQDIGGKFDQLESDVDAKQESLVSDLANKYVESRNAVDAEIAAEQEKNKGLVDKAKDAVGSSLEAIAKLKDLFMGVLARAANAFTKILADPVAFITNFMNAVKQGFMSFVGKIWAHLKTGLMGWLFGALASAGIQLPEKFDLKGILGLITSLLGLTWAAIKARLVRRLPAKVIDFLESKVEVFMILATEGPAGLWNWIKDKVGDLKEQILGPIKAFVVEKIIKAGVTWVLGLLNPAGALIKIVQALVSVVQWIMERGAALVDFVQTVIGAVSDIAHGGVGGVPAKIEASLAKALPLVISFLASLLGLGGISEKIKAVIAAVQKPVKAAIDAVIKGALKLAKPLIAKLKGIGNKAKAKLLGGDDSPEGRHKRLHKGLDAGVAAANRFAGKPVGARVLKPVLGGIRIRYGLATLKPVAGPKHWSIDAAISRMAKETRAEVSSDREALEAVRKKRETASNAREKKAKDPVKRLRKGVQKGTLSDAQMSTARKTIADYDTLDATFRAKAEVFEAMRSAKAGDQALLSDLGAFFSSAAEQFQILAEDAHTILSSPEEIASEAQRLLKEIEARVSQADSILSDPEVIANVLSRDKYADRAKRASRAREDVAKANAVVPEVVRDLQSLKQLRALESLVNTLQSETAQLAKLKSLTVQIEDELAAIERIIEQNQKPGAEVGESGTSEEAVAHEVSTGDEVKGRRHGEKCAHDARGLEKIIDELALLATRPGSEPFNAEIEAAKARATTRRASLLAAAQVWERRSITHPHIWDEEGNLRQERAPR